jgi:hypothetical protein
MCIRLFLSVLTIVGMAAWHANGAISQTPTAPPAQAAPTEGVEVLARGPVHEAFAEVADVKIEPPPVVPKEPPKPIEEIPPDQKPDDPNVQWIPGYWAWDDDRSDFIWVSGVWRIPPPGRQWVSGHWQKVENGWQWVPGFWASMENNEYTVLPPPPDPVDEGPSSPAPDATSTYVPGCWVYQDGRYLWRPGYWNAFHDGWAWTPAHYLWAPSGAIFVEGFWDYPLINRGLLFASAYIDRSLWSRPNWTYTPQYLVNGESLLASLFVRPATRHYYFGDYFGDRYAKAGFVPWTTAGIDRHTPDPLFSYYRHRPEGAAWERDMRDVYGARARGQGVPPRTWVQQNKVVENLRRDKNVNNTTINRMSVVHPLAQADARAAKLRDVDRDGHVELKKSADWHRQVQVQRGAHATQALSRGAAGAGRAARPPAPATVRLPPAPHPARTPVKTPPAPKLPQHVEKKR